MQPWWRNNICLHPCVQCWRFWDIFPRCWIGVHSRVWKPGTVWNREKCHNLKLLLRFELVRQVIVMAGWQPHNLKTRLEPGRQMIYLDFYVAHFDAFSNGAGSLNLRSHSDHVTLFRAFLCLNFMAKVKKKKKANQSLALCNITNW